MLNDFVTGTLEDSNGCKICYFKGKPYKEHRGWLSRKGTMFTLQSFTAMTPITAQDYCEVVRGDSGQLTAIVIGTLCAFVQKRLYSTAAVEPRRKAKHYIWFAETRRTYALAGRL